MSYCRGNGRSPLFSSPPDRTKNHATIPRSSPDGYREVEEFETALEERERAAGIEPERDKSLVDRLAALGVPKEAIDETIELMGAFELIMKDRPEELPGRIRRKLAETAEAGISALDQLQDILDGRQGKH